MMGGGMMWDTGLGSVFAPVTGVKSPDAEIDPPTSSQPLTVQTCTVPIS